MLTEPLANPASAPQAAAAPAACVVCGSRNVSVFFEAAGMPVSAHILWPTREAALACPRGDMRLAFCAGCGHVGNAAFESPRAVYGQQYENSLHFSPRFQAYAESLAADLIERHGLRGKDVIDLGCGKGEFLALLCRMGNNRGVGFDASYVEGRVDARAGRGIEFVQDYYSERYGHYPCDLLACRHVLEHIPDPLAFLGDVRAAIGNRRETVVFFEVPNGLFTFRDGGIWDLIYEHCSYFTADSLAELFARAGFGVRRVEEAYGGQFLCLEAGLDAAASRPAASDRCDTEKHLQRFSQQHRETLARWTEYLSQVRRAGRKLALWGAGSKSVTFLNTFLSQADVACVVDLNPHKQGHYIGGTGHRIVAPEFLSSERPDEVLLMNPLYEAEVTAGLASLEVPARLTVVR